MAGQDFGMPESGEILIEFHYQGTWLKVSAVDPVSLTEVSIVGDPAAGEEALKRAVVRKLAYVLERRGQPPRQPIARGGP